MVDVAEDVYDAAERLVRACAAPCSVDEKPVPRAFRVAAKRDSGAPAQTRCADPGTLALLGDAADSSAKGFHPDPQSRDRESLRCGSLEAIPLEGDQS